MTRNDSPAQTQPLAFVTGFLSVFLAWVQRVHGSSVFYFIFARYYRLCASCTTALDSFQIAMWFFHRMLVVLGVLFK